MEGVWLENANLLSAISVSGRLVIRRSNFLKKVQGADHLLCAFSTAGFMARPPDIGSVWCTPIFQVSN